jgi:hypothetical protein
MEETMHFKLSIATATALLATISFAAMWEPYRVESSVPVISNAGFDSIAVSPGGPSERVGSIYGAFGLEHIFNDPGPKKVAQGYFTTQWTITVKWNPEGGSIEPPDESQISGTIKREWISEAWAGLHFGDKSPQFLSIAEISMWDVYAAPRSVSLLASTDVFDYEGNPEFTLTSPLTFSFGDPYYFDGHWYAIQTITEASTNATAEVGPMFGNPPNGTNHGHHATATIWKRITLD